MAVRRVAVVMTLRLWLRAAVRFGVYRLLVLARLIGTASVLVAAARLSPLSILLLPSVLLLALVARLLVLLLLLLLLPLSLSPLLLPSCAMLAVVVVVVVGGWGPQRSGDPAAAHTAAMRRHLSSPNTPSTSGARGDAGAGAVMWRVSRGARRTRMRLRWTVPMAPSWSRP